MGKAISLNQSIGSLNLAPVVWDLVAKSPLERVDTDKWRENASSIAMLEASEQRAAGGTQGGHEVHLNCSDPCNPTRPVLPGLRVRG